MEEYLKQLLRHLPIQFEDEEANEFVRYLGEAFIENFERKKYQFAFTAFHMLNMIFAYKVKWFLKEQNNQNIVDSLTNFISQNKGTKFNALFDLSVFPEKASFEILMQALGLHANEIKTCKNHIDVRNNCSHASGKIYYKTPERIGNYIKEEVEAIEEIQSKLKTEFKAFLENFLDKNWQQTFLPGDFMNIFKSNFLSLEDLILISTVNISWKKTNNEKNIKQKILYLLLISSIQDQIESERNLFLEKLSDILVGLPEKIKIKKGEESMEIFTSELIETFLSPVISNFSDNERKIAEKTLKLGEI